ncbi:MAG TPA: DUF445 domain-containing protein [Planctomycetota bacterium]|nr:DUF445 domain-containing protein [Planctomycetota bacterium]
MRIKRHLGTLSLVAVTGLFAGLEAALRGGLAGGPVVRILASAFEAGVVGGLADWFAVTALFREVPIPFLRRHTNILLRKREALTEHIVDVVQNRWLTPEAISEYLSQRSPSGALLDYLADPRHERQLLDALRDVLAAIVDRLDGPEMSGFLGQALRRQIDRPDFDRFVGEQLEGAIRRGDHGPAIDTLLGVVESSVREGSLRALVRGWIEEAAKTYAARGTLKAATTWMLEKSGGLDYERAAEDIVNAVATSIHGVRGQADHPLRQRIEEAARRFARGLMESGEAPRAALERFRRGVSEGLESEAGLREILRRLKESLRAQLTEPGSAFMLAAGSFLHARLAELKTDGELRGRIDAWVRETAKGVVERNPAMIGEMIRTSLTKLEGPELVQQIEDKVGPELQYIRLNGAVIGTLVGLCLGTARVILG